MAKARKDNKGRVLLRGESQRSQDMRYVYTYTDPFGNRKYLYATDLMELRQKILRIAPLSCSGVFICGVLLSACQYIHVISDRSFYMEGRTLRVL